MNWFIELLFVTSVLILFVIFVRFIFLRKVKSCVIYALWLVVLVRLMCPVNLVTSSFSIMNHVESVKTVLHESEKEKNDVDIFKDSNTVSEIEDLNVEKKDSNIAAKNDAGAKELNNEVNIISGKVQEEANNQEKNQTEVNVNRNTFQILPVHMIIFAWAIGSAICFLFFIKSNLKFKRMLINSREKMDQYGVGKCPVYQTDKVSIPCLYGFLKPAIYIPEIVLKELSEYDVKQILEHERMHCKHWDYIWSIVRCVIVSIYWFHPLVWMAARLSKKDAELACDESILAHKSKDESVRYGEMLINVARVSNKIPFFCSVTAVHNGKKEMKKRIQQIGSNRRYHKSIFLLFFIVILAGVFVTFSACDDTKKVEKDNTQETKKEEYTIVSRKYSINGFELQIPQVEGIMSETGQYINSAIKKSIDNRFKKLSSDVTLHYFDYSVENQDEEILSILMQYDYMLKGAAHPTAQAFAINVDMNTGKKMKREDVLSYEQLKYAVENNNVKPIVKNNHGLLDKERRYLKDDEMLESFYDIEQYQFYVSGGQIGLIFEVPYAAGSYQIRQMPDMKQGDFGIMQYMNIWHDLEQTYHGVVAQDSENYAEKNELELYCTEVEIEGLKNGTVYNLHADDIGDIGYLYIVEDKVYEFEGTEEDMEVLENNKMPRNAYIVCQKEEMKDQLGDNEKGFHQYIKIEGDTIEYHAYDNQAENGKFETIKWKKDVGITYYESGYGAGTATVKLEIDTKDHLARKYQEKMKAYTDGAISQVIEEDFDDCGEKEAFVLVNSQKGNEEEPETNSALWYVKGNKVQKIVDETMGIGATIDLLSVQGHKHILFNLEQARLGDGVIVMIYKVEQNKVVKIFEQKYLNLFMEKGGLYGYGQDYYLYDKDVKVWMAYCALPYHFYWNEEKGTYEEYVANEISEKDFMKLSGAKEILDEVLDEWYKYYVGREKVVGIEKTYLARTDGTIDINFILLHKNGEKRKYCVTVEKDGNSIKKSKAVNEGNKQLSLIESLKEFEKTNE